ncbi:MAG: thioredoxin family protein [Emticicia sp.]|nr:thioredoxin family protein [Emticicia sp.]
MKNMIFMSQKILLISSIITFSLLTSITGNAQSKSSTDTKPKVTFYELGSVRCIPCKQMQPVIKSIEEKYGSQVQVIFHDVWTPEGKEAAKRFTFEAIPTQIFEDENGKEIFRHVGFFPEKEIEKVLAKNGVK